MKQFTSTYLSLGSNQGNRLANIQQAIELIFEEVGNVTQVSKVYESKSWGFDGEDFLNVCIEVQTNLQPLNLLRLLQHIEIQLGRTSSVEKSTYENRPIDIDILWMEKEILKTEMLQLPHPRMLERNFVLAPLNDIASDKLIPDFELKVSEVLKQCTDQVEAIVIEAKLKLPSYPKLNYTYIALEGNIGAGKTSLATMISTDYNAKFIPERFKDNPFLPKFYKDQSRYAFPLEMSFLADRHQQLLDDISQFDLFSEFVVADYDFYKSLIFARVTLGEEEYGLYKKIFDIMYKDLPKPDLYIYLYQNTDRLLANIKKRGRSYEQEIEAAYLDNINKGYLSFIKSQQHLNIKVIDISDLDFVHHRKDYLYLIRQIAEVN